MSYIFINVYDYIDDVISGIQQQQPLITGSVTQ